LEPAPAVVDAAVASEATLFKERRLADVPVEKVAPAEPIIPMLHAPDDPGPGGPVPDPDGEPVTPAEGQRWQTVKDLFK
jgi:hypothetical protein